LFSKVAFKTLDISQGSVSKYASHRTIEWCL